MRTTQRNIVTQLLWLSAAVLTAQTTPNWTRQIPPAFPPGRFSHAMAYDAAHGQVVVFGGVYGFGGFYASAQALGDTWVWDGSTWTQKSVSTGPSPRAAHSMTYDAAHGQVVLFGGYSNGNVSTDTWVWDGSNWTRKSPANSPSTRIYYAMAYDSAHGQVVLFGGANAGNGAALADTWVWDGSNWTQKSPGASPPARSGHVMAYDSAHGQVVLFGGLAGMFLALNETWVWDGVNWTQKSPKNSPSVSNVPASSAAMSYDSAHGQVVLFGAGVNANETWLWDGTNWTQQSPQTSPQSRSYIAMAYDSAHSQAVLFGGVDFNEMELADTWTWQGGALPVMAPSIASVVSASAYGGFTAVSSGSYVEIYGSNLAPDTRGWSGADFTGSQAPTSLDGVAVTIAGQKAFVNYIVASPGQVNVQLPSNIPTGAQQLTVTNLKNGTSAPFKVTVSATTPGLLAPSPFKIGGNQYVVALLPDNVTYILPEGAISGLPVRPAKPGETIVLWGNGFGSVTPNIPAGQVVQAGNQLAASLEIMFGGTPAMLAYFGLSPGLVGVYQFNVVVPAIADSDLVPLTFKLDGVPGTQTLYTSVRQ